MPGTSSLPPCFMNLHERSIVFRAGEEEKRSHRATEVRPALLQDRAGLLGAAHLPMLLVERSASTLWPAERTLRTLNSNPGRTAPWFQFGTPGFLRRLRNSF